mgnify:CR=1 FL=1
MKIIQLIQKPQERGAELFASLLSEELKKMGHEVILLSLFEGKSKLSFSDRQIHFQRSLKKRLWDLKGWRRFAELIQNEKPDLIQANAGDTLKFAVASKLIFGWKAPVVFRNASIISGYISNPGIRLLNQFLLNQVQGIASVSRASQVDMNRIFNLKNPVQQVIPIGINTELQKPRISNSKMKELVHIGGFTFEKNHFHLLDIFEELLQVDGEFHLKLTGDGSLFNQVKNEVLKRSLSEKVDFTGSIKDPFSVISSNSILLLPSKIEGLPSVILEAMFHKIPVIAYGVGGIPEILKTGETGWCIPPGDKMRFIQAIQEVSNLDSNTKGRILENAFAMVQERFTLEKVTHQFEEFYQSILHSSR